MKKLIPFVTFLLAGCGSHWPKDAYIKDGEVTINTPWGPQISKAAVIATGAAAKNLTEDEKRELLTPTKK